MFRLLHPMRAKSSIYGTTSCSVESDAQHCHRSSHHLASVPWRYPSFYLSWYCLSLRPQLNLEAHAILAKRPVVSLHSGVGHQVLRRHFLPPSWLPIGLVGLECACFQIPLQILHHFHLHLADQKMPWGSSFLHHARLIASDPTKPKRCYYCGPKARLPSYTTRWTKALQCMDYATGIVMSENCCVEIMVIDTNLLEQRVNDSILLTDLSQEILSFANIGRKVSRWRRRRTTRRRGRNRKSGGQ